MCFISLIFTGVLFFLLTIWPMPVYNDTTFEDSRIQVTGEVLQKECKNNKFLIYLKNAYRSGSDIPKETYRSRDGTEGILVYCGASISSYDELPPIGSIVCIRGNKKLFSRPRNEGQFDMARYYQIRDIDYMLMDGQVEAVSRTYDSVLESLALLRQKLCRTYNSILNEQDASILCAMLLGDKTGVDPELKELYQRAGLSHTLCISGLHISLLGIALYRLLRKLFVPLPIAAGISAVLILGYGIMTGMGTATKRAIIMFLLCILADVVGRTYDLLSAMAFAAVLTLLGKPLLLYDSGFLLSFGAILGIGLVAPCMEHIFPWKNRIFQALRLSFSISLFTFPLTLYFFFQYPVYSMFLNLLMIPLMTYLLLNAILCGIVGSLCVGAGTVLAIPCHIILLIYERGCTLCEKMPGSIAVFGKPAAVQIVFYYVLLGVLLVVSSRKLQRKRLQLSCMLICSAMILLCVYRPMPELTVSMVDVGQGDCILLRQRGGLVCLIDGGSTDNKQVGKYCILPVLKSQGIDKLDYVFVSHTDADHMNGIAELLDSIETTGVKIGTLVMPQVEDESQEYVGLVETAKNRGVSVCYFKQGDFLKKDALTLTCLYPQAGQKVESKNAGSMVLRFAYGGKTGLFTGDLEGKGEEEVSKTLEEEEYLFLKVAHHGSKNSTKEEFLGKVHPKISLISCGVDNSYGHPSAELLERLERTESLVYITQNKGEIKLSFQGEKIKINCFLE